MDEHADRLDDVRTDLAALDDGDVAGHVATISRSLDTLVDELDVLARSIPPAR